MSTSYPKPDAGFVPGNAGVLIIRTATANGQHTADSVVAMAESSNPHAIELDFRGHGFMEARVIQAAINVVDRLPMVVKRRITQVTVDANVTVIAPVLSALQITIPALFITASHAEGHVALCPEANMAYCILTFMSALVAHKVTVGDVYVRYTGPLHDYSKAALHLHMSARVSAILGSAFTCGSVQIVGGQHHFVIHSPLHGGNVGFNVFM